MCFVVAQQHLVLAFRGQIVLVRLLKQTWAIHRLVSTGTLFPDFQHL